MDALTGAASGLLASWVMEKVQPRIMDLGGPETKQRERRAQEGVEPATVQVAKRIAGAARTSVPEERMGAAAEAVHYLTGAAFGALFGVLARRVGLPVLAVGVAYGAAVWLVNDEALVPALGLSRGPLDYPPSTHAKALASHVVYGAATGAGVRLARVALH